MPSTVAFEPGVESQVHQLLESIDNLRDRVARMQVIRENFEARRRSLETRLGTRLDPRSWQDTFAPSGVEIAGICPRRVSKALGWRQRQFLHLALQLQEAVPKAMRHVVRVDSMLAGAIKSDCALFPVCQQQQQERIHGGAAASR